MGLDLFTHTHIIIENRKTQRKLKETARIGLNEQVNIYYYALYVIYIFLTSFSFIFIQNRKPCKTAKTTLHFLHYATHSYTYPYVNLIKTHLC